MRKPVVFIPGFPASELKNASGTSIYPPSPQTLADPDRRKNFIRAITTHALVAGEPIRDVMHGLSKQAATLYDILRAYGYSTKNTSELALVGWNWMRAIDDDDVMASVVRSVDSLFDAAGPVVVIAHSTGGLVLRRFLELHPGALRKIEHIVAFGVPWGGTLKSFRFLTKGEPFGILNARLSASETREIMRHAQAAYDLLPPDAVAGAAPGEQPPALVFAGSTPVSPCSATQWIPAGNDFDYMRANAAVAGRLARKPEIFEAGIGMPEMTNVVGWGAWTDTKARMTAKGKVDFEKTKEGDGTIPTVSASWLGATPARTYHVPIGTYATNAIPTYHSQIWDAPPLLDLFDQVLDDAPREAFVAASIDADDASEGGASGLTVRVAAADADARPLSNASVSFEGLTLRNPIPLGRSTHVDVVLEASALPPRLVPGLFRFVAVVSWDETSGRKHRELPLILRR